MEKEAPELQSAAYSPSHYESLVIDYENAVAEVEGHQLMRTSSLFVICLVTGLAIFGTQELEGFLRLGASIVAGICFLIILSEIGSIIEHPRLEARVDRALDRIHVFRVALMLHRDIAKLKEDR